MAALGRKFGVLFIGAGNITFGNDNVLWNHSLRIEAYLGARLDVIGIIDPSAERVKQVLSQKSTSAAATCYANTKHFFTLQEAQEKLAHMKINPDLILLATPPHFRGTMQHGRDLEVQVVSAFGSAPALFVEKPVSTARPLEVWPVAKILQQSGNNVAVGYMLRYLKVVQKAMSILHDNNVKVMAVNARYSMAYSRVRKTDWWNKAKQCGPIVEQATHFCDLCRYLGGEVDLATVRACALEHYEPAGQLSSMLVDESQIPTEERIPRVTAAFWKYQGGAVGSLMHIVALHGIRYSNEIVVAGDGFQLRLVDLYSAPTLYVRTPISEQEESFTFINDDPFYSEFAGLLGSLGAAPCPEAVKNARSEEQGFVAPSDGILSSYEDACKTYEFTWRIRDESEKSSQQFREK
ncbi:hypothetical protein AYO21_10070 [Fonsecaea monophora]|uniref:Gfo/Idh/MocA-like oxidoreductase N-terminal domain-containing protein n=1 Tax=Fonsecaea monophora TaxID=254056 RepID=A0A177EUQ0_9EURO|nr:hypothetical protein AYO21_10070 [Fonsecaea monophora]OAG35753.1 hypothetical protein AYO21_10070 [Fonsecaea monophora]